jgi:glycosyltransferase involved in cell wall biosynthesis
MKDVPNCVLLSAYACEPGRGSEPGVGWAWARELSECVDLSVLTRTNNRDTIEQSGECWVGKVSWIYYDLPRWALWWKRGARGANLYYCLWQIGAYIHVRKIHRRTPFDIIHHATFGRYWVPSWLSLLDAAFVFGPVGGGEDTPSGLRAGFSWAGRVADAVRSVARRLAELDPVLRYSLHRSRSVAVAATEETARKLRSLGVGRCEIVPQCALDKKQIATFDALPRPKRDRFRVISIGRLVSWKGYHLGIRSFALLSAQFTNAEYWIVNDGPEMERLKSLSNDLGLGEKVKFLGKLPSLTDVYAALGQSDLLLHPALHEAFGNVCLEAMAAGRPVVCLQGGGPGFQVTNSTGLAVPATSESQTVGALAQALSQLARDPERRLAMGIAARKRARDNFVWSTVAEIMLGVYFSVATKKMIPQNSENQ